jgi:hypothetical protein
VYVYAKSGAGVAIAASNRPVESEPMSASSEEYVRDPVWGPMSHPAKGLIEPGSPPWKDHIYLAYWDAKHDAYGYFHWNSSPNHPTHKAQIMAVLGGQEITVIEPLPAAALHFHAPSLDFDLRSTIRVTNERIRGELTATPRFKPVDYTPGETIPPLVPGKPLNHHQQGLTLQGELILDGVRYEIDARGFRTRTWGFRDDSMQFVEYFSLFACFENFDVSAMKFRWPDGRQLVDGGIMTGAGSQPIKGVGIRRDRAGSPLRLLLTPDGGADLELKRRLREAHFWCPIGLPERDGPTFCAHDEVVEWETVRGESGSGLSEQGIIRFVA